MNQEKGIMVDLYCGPAPDQMEGGASSAFEDGGYEVIRVDIEPTYNPDICGDLRDRHIRHKLLTRLGGARPTLVWASPPCDEFARESMPWSKTGKEPDLSLVHAAVDVIQETDPEWWVIETTKGGVKWLRRLLEERGMLVSPEGKKVGNEPGGPRHVLFGHYPLFEARAHGPRKYMMNSKQKEERARIPYPVAEALYLAIEAYRPPAMKQGGVKEGSHP